MLRYATVGTSAITEKFIAACRLTGRYTPAVCYSRSLSRGQDFASRHGFEKATDDLTALASDPSVDAVYIASPNVCHAKQAKLFLSHGKHVLVEKPAVTSARELDELFSLADENGVVFLEAIKPRFYAPGRDALKEALPLLGKISHARFDFSQRSSRYDALCAGEHINIFDMSLHAGTLMDIGIYCVYAAVDLLGMPERIVCSTADTFENGADFAGLTVFDYGTFHAVLTYGKIGAGALGSEIVGDRGTITLGKLSQYLDSALTLTGGEPQVLHGNFDPVTTMRGEADRFADFITAPEANAADYAAFRTLCKNVHTCMDTIKKQAGLRYPAKKT